LTSAIRLEAVLQSFHPGTADEQRDLERVRELSARGDPWTRSSPLHVTGSALVFHPPSDRVLLRWHERQQRWLQVGGHADPGETDPFAVALREAREETGLTDLSPWPKAAEPEPIQLVIVPVPARDLVARVEYEDGIPMDYVGGSSSEPVSTATRRHGARCSERCERMFDHDTSLRRT